MSAPELFQFEFSHYNEKARWGLDYKGIAHHRVSLLPGPHGARIRRLTGQTSLPVLRSGGEVIAGSASILAWLEERHPEPPLLPRDPTSRRTALAIQERFDREVGPQIRQAAFFDILTDARFASALFAIGQRGIRKTVYRLVFPLLIPVLRRNMNIDAETAEAGRRRTLAALDFVAHTSAGTGHLVGDSFTIADLTAAALLFPTALPGELPFTVPQPMAPAMASWLSRWADHPGVRWVKETYRRNRGTWRTVERGE
jgi:glutathione S-transferase